jgi:23S rRNA (cytidine1920-2'-O)/16S rRNA (cytidine1409-2'-O)-methyltransferase
MHPNKQRLDIIVRNKGLAQSRQRARSLIMAGKILVNQQPVDKPGTLISETACIRLKGEDIAYVSRGGLKLEAALRAFDIDVVNRQCLDVGASTGGFTDCLLQRGAARVFAVDVGYGQLAWRLRQDSRVVVIERTNIRHMPFETIGRQVDMITIDVSFISLKIVVPAVLKYVKQNSAIIALVKPQFEVGKGQVGKGGVVRDSRLHADVLGDLNAFFSDTGLSNVNMIESPILGPKGNKEFLILLKQVHRYTAK